MSPGSGTTSLGTTSGETTSSSTTTGTDDGGAESSEGGGSDTGEPFELETPELPVGFEDWGVIGMTDRTDGADSSTIRIVVGNEVAVEAARAGTTPWPDGSILVDVVWGDGNNMYSDDMVAPGNFGALAVMEKDAERFEATGGWGYALFRGDELEPVGPEAIANPDDPVDETTCFGCHNSRVPDRDFVFTEPLGFPTPSELEGADTHMNGMTLPAGLLGWRFISVHHRLANTQMRVVLGNDTAVEAARRGDTDPWPDGTQLADVVFAASADGVEGWTDMIAPQSLAAIALMERDPTEFDTTGDWGYALWANGDDGLTPGGFGGTADDMQTCFGCHNLEVGTANDYVFTRPGPLPLD